ncbi:hypothetical protein KP509_36G056300 [Ceratopteris richardii]|uniref:Uncharacterized protein n=1 Tax=Ceratopteris richardii TaxID=49495 RepID=A0A8T2QBY9_CERRI|nr:hypothetical protein KP509_36G056300 [Ceratopteris richardii]
MFRTPVTSFARTARRPPQIFKSKSVPGIKKPVDPRVTPEEAFRLADILHSILHNQGPLTVAGCWSHAQSQGFTSKGHMKVILRWMKERHRVKLLGHHKNRKETDEESMQYATLFYNEAAESYRSQDANESKHEGSLG